MTEEQMMKAKSLAYIQAQVKAPKGQFNAFGKYKYRSAEDIMEAVKPVINPLGYYLIVSDEIIEVGDRYYVKATAKLTDGNNLYSCTGFAREEEQKKGMDGSQITGAASSYARKYALSGLFCLDDNADADKTNTHGKEDYTDFILELKNVKTLNDLTILYNSNKEVVDGNMALKKLFTERKNQLK